MRYYLTMERTLRVCVPFEAADSDEASTKAKEMFDEAIDHPTQFEGGDVEHDFALTDDQYRDIIPWR